MKRGGFEVKKRQGPRFRSWAAICAAAILLALVSAPASAQPPPYGSIGLYVDDARSSNTVTYAGPYTEFTMYVFVKPGPQGLTSLEFAVEYPSNVLAAEVTPNPLLSIELGSLGEGIAAAFLECQNDWVWTHQQIMYLRDTSSSRIAVVKHPASTIYQAYTCELGYQSLFLSSYVCLNSPFEPDTTAPSAVSVDCMSYGSVTLAFSEPLIKDSAQNESNYEVVDYDDPAHTHPISEAEFWSTGTKVSLYLAEPLVLGQTYRVRVHGLLDLWGNEASTELLLTVGEPGAPKIQQITSEGDSVLYVDFSRQMAPGPAGNHANYVLYCSPYDPQYPQGYRCDAQPYTAALVSPMRARVAFWMPRPPVESALYLKVNNLTDTGGQPITAPYDVKSFVITDFTPPFMMSLTMLSMNTIKAVFNEVVRDSTVNVPGNYLVRKQSDTTFTIPVIGAVITNDKKGVTLTLGADLVTGVGYTLRWRGIMDARGNRWPGWMESNFTANDRRPPVALSAAALSRGLVRVVFDEALDPVSAQTKAYYQVGTNPGVPISAAELETGGCAVRLTLGGQLDYDTEYQLTVRSIKDVSGNTMIRVYYLSVAYPDTTPPSVTGVNGISEREIELAFDMKLKASPAELVSNYGLVESGEGGGGVPILAAILSSDQLHATLSLGAPLIAGTGYTISMSNIEDLKGHIVVPGTEATFVFLDTTAPTLLEAHAPSSAVVLADFSEPLDPATAQGVSHYVITESTSSTPAVSISSAELIGDSTKVQLTLGNPLNTFAQYVLHVTGVRDRALNAIAADSRMAISADSLPPTYRAYVETSMRVFVVFGKRVTEESASIPANYRLASITAPCDTFVPTGVEYLGYSIRLTFASPLIAGHVYSLLVSNVQDMNGLPVPPGSESRFIYPLSNNYGAIGLYADSHRYSNSVHPAPYEEFSFYVWCYADPYGLNEIQYCNTYPSGIVPELDEPNSAVVQQWSGEPGGYCHATLSQCASGWVWICKETCINLNQYNSGVVSFQRGIGTPLFTTCAEGNPTETASIWCSLNLDGVYVATLLKDFSASFGNGAVELSWELTSLDEGARMIVSRAELGSEQYRELAGEIEGKDLAFSYSDERIEPGKSYTYRVDYALGSQRHSLFETEPVAVPILPMSLSQNWPNPFNPTTTISYYLPRASAVRLEVFDVSGRRIACIDSGLKEAGKHSAGWNGKDESGRQAAAGIYLYRLTAGKETLSRKMILLR